MNEAPRKDVVRALCDEATEAMAEKCQAIGASPSEVLSACFTLLQRSMRVILKGSKGTDLADNRSVMIDGLMTLFKSAEGTVQ